MKVADGTWGDIWKVFTLTSGDDGMVWSINDPELTPYAASMKYPNAYNVYMNIVLASATTVTYGAQFCHTVWGPLGGYTGTFTVFYKRRNM